LVDPANVKTWHLAFNRLDDLPEILLQARDRELLTWLFRAKSTRPWTITPADDVATSVACRNPQPPRLC